jgi:hypothetical protein
MGANDSRPEDTSFTYGYRVVSVIPGSPADLAGIEPQLDFIKYYPQHYGNKLFYEYLQANSGQMINLYVYNIIQQDTRIVRIQLPQ